MQTLGSAYPLDTIAIDSGSSKRRSIVMKLTDPVTHRRDWQTAACGDFGIPVSAGSNRAPGPVEQHQRYPSPCTEFIVAEIRGVAYVNASGPQRRANWRR